MSDRREIYILYAAIHYTGQNYSNLVFLYEYILIVSDEVREKGFDEIHKHLIHRITNYEISDAERNTHQKLPESMLMIQMIWIMVLLG